MDIVMTRQTMKNATLMVGIVVKMLLKQSTVRCVYAKVNALTMIG